MPKKTKDRYYLKIRRYPEGRFVTMWLCVANGAGHASFLHGEVLPSRAEALAEVLGLPVETEDSPLPGISPMRSANLAQQQLLFPEPAQEESQ